MPEGPEVKTITDKLCSSLKGKILKGLGWDRSSKYSDGLLGYQQQIEPYLPMTIENITCKGKQIFFKLNKDNKYVIYLNSTLGMEGRWSWKAGDHSNFWLICCDQIVNGTIKLVIGSKCVYFDDSRHFGNLTIRNEQDYMTKLSEIGPDLLSEDVNISIWLQKARNKRIKDKQICDFLMDQKYFSSIGNYLKSTILYAAKIKPDRTLSNLSDQELELILHHSKRILQESYALGGLTVRTYWDPDEKKGNFVCDVYDKDVDPLGNKIIKSTFKDGRTTHWVPAIQI
jgi:formamidopyrimidine-DNA glycosylase